MTHVARTKFAGVALLAAGGFMIAVNGFVPRSAGSADFAHSDEPRIEDRKRLSAEMAGPTAEGQDAMKSEVSNDDAVGRLVRAKPWETTVRIKIPGKGLVSFGSGTIVWSTPKESLILCTAHVFNVVGAAQGPPAAFDLPIKVDLFDCKPSQGDIRQVHYAGTCLGEVIDFDRPRDVGLIRIRPGRRLPFSRLVPEGWRPKVGTKLITVGCDEGRDPTVWSTTVSRFFVKGLIGNDDYEAIECTKVPKQGRSGGGLFTEEGNLTGVCNFAEPIGNHGLYATPSAIYRLLDRNELTALYSNDPANAPETEVEPDSAVPGAQVLTGRRAPRSTPTATTVDERLSQVENKLDLIIKLLGNPRKD
jgi:hypothetical protein